MIILLLILVIFYSNIGFFFMPSQFEIQLDDVTNFLIYRGKKLMRVQIY
jgi:hypothetical protein